MKVFCSQAETLAQCPRLCGLVDLLKRWFHEFGEGDFFLPKHDAKTTATHNLVNFLFHLPNWVSGSHAETRLGVSVDPCSRESVEVLAQSRTFLQLNGGQYAGF